MAHGDPVEDKIRADAKADADQRQAEREAAAAVDEPDNTPSTDEDIDNILDNFGLNAILAGLLAPDVADEEYVEGTATGEAWDSPRAYPTITQYPDDPNFASGDRPSDYGLRPQYSEFDYQYILNGMTTFELAGLERQLQQAGYIGEDDILSDGLSRASLLGHFKALIQEADSNRNTWEDQLNENIRLYQQWLEDNPEEEEKTWRELNPFVSPAELRPDYASLASRVKAEFRNDLGRSATSAEMKLLTGELSGAFHDAWKSNELAPARGAWEARARAQETGEAQVAGAFDAVDPEARFTEGFDERFKGELGHRQRVDQTQSNTSSLFGSLDMLSRSI